MILEIYNEKDVSKIDKERCYSNYTSAQFGTYTIIGNFYVVFKDIRFSIVHAVIKLL